jgi:hypothetical protein
LACTGKAATRSARTKTIDRAAIGIVVVMKRELDYEWTASPCLPVVRG